MKMILTSKIRQVHWIMFQFFRLVGLALLLSVGIGSVGQVTSFDCAKATTETVITICADPAVSTLDV